MYHCHTSWVYGPENKLNLLQPNTEQNTGDKQTFININIGIVNN